MQSFEIPAHVNELANTDLVLATKAALAAGQIIRTNYYNNAENNAAAKGYQGDLVTETDKECDKAIHKILGETRYQILSEELQNNTSEDGNKLWVVDPLDGTAGFAFQAGKDVPAVMIALRENFKTVLSVVLRPLTNELFYAVKDQGAYRNGTRVWTDKTSTDLTEAWVAMNHYGDIKLQTGLFRNADARLRRKGGPSMVTRPVPYSGIALNMLGEGKTLAAVIHDNNKKNPKQGPWDIIPIQLIVNEAGGVVLNLNDGTPVNPYDAKPFIVAANQAMATAIMKRVNANT